MPKWEKGPWKVEIRRNLAGYVSGLRVLAAEPRVVMCTTFQAETITDRVGNQTLKPGTQPKVTTDTSVQPAKVCGCQIQPIEICDCGISYAGLSSEALLANGDLIAAAPELYAALEQITQWAGGMDAERLPAPWPEMVHQAQAALAKARGEQPAPGEEEIYCTVCGFKDEAWRHRSCIAAPAPQSGSARTAQEAVEQLEHVSVNRDATPADYAAPVTYSGFRHQFMAAADHRFCTNCGAGRLHAIHLGGAHAR